MNQSKAFLVSFAAAAVAMLLVFFYINSETQKIKAEYGSEVVVVVAKRDINEMEEIKADMLETRNVPKSFQQPGSNGDPRTFEGSVAAAPMKAKEQVLLTKVYLKGSDTGVASQVAIHQRAISIPVNDVTGVTRLLRPGDRVDIIANIQYPSPAGVQSEIKTMLQNVNVLAVGEQVQNNIPAIFDTDPVTGGRFAKNIRGNRTFNTVTVEVSPVDAQKVIYIVESGVGLFLTLRNPVDRLVASIPTVTIDEVLGENSRKAAMDAKARAPAAAPVATRAPVKTAPPPPAFKQGGIPLAN
ncbi:MAG: Flp pilus assembly protein CpaB [Bdellovibrionota bacterium]